MVVIIEGLEISNFRNIEKFKGEFGDLNILIGPNNAGKSNVLNVIDRISNAKCNKSSGFPCNYCSRIREKISKDITFGGIVFETTESDWHRKIEPPTVTCSFNKGLVMYYWLNKNRSEIPEILSYIQQADKNISSNADVQPAITGGMLSFINYLKSNKLGDKLFDIFEDYYIKRLSDQLSEEELKEHLEREVKNNLFIMNLVYKSGSGDSIYGKDISILSEIRKPGSIISGIIDKDRVLLCSDLRLNEYNGIPISEYISKKDHTETNLKRFKAFINKIVDPPIQDIRFPGKDSNTPLALLFDGFEDSIENQGSGTRSLIGLAWDIITMKRGSIVIVDEPELGLHPSAKQEFLKLLLKEAETKQIFIATHDPTFVNPVIWQEFIREKKSEKFSVKVLLYSIYNQTFVNVDLDISKEDPETFAGYLPHTTSLKKAHIYVEGPSDVCIFQIWLEKYLKEKMHENWLKKFNEIGIYHLAGDNWMHLLYTIPRGPYKCMVILDGDTAKAKVNAKEVCERYNKAKFENISRFKFCQDVGEISFDSDLHPVYCLERKEIECYFDPMLLTICIVDQSKLDSLSLHKEIKTINELKDVCNDLFSLNEANPNIYEHQQGKLQEIDGRIEIGDIEIRDKEKYGLLIADKMGVPDETKGIFDSILDKTESQRFQNYPISE